MEWDKGPPDADTSRSNRFDRYREAALQLLREHKAYPCYCTAEELDAKRKQAEREHRKPGYDGKCRDLPIPRGPRAARQTRRPQLHDSLSHAARRARPWSTIWSRAAPCFDNAELDDLIIFRSDGVPTYNFATVLDDVDFDITHVVRGDDHRPEHAAPDADVLRARASRRRRSRICRR